VFTFLVSTGPSLAVAILVAAAVYLRQGRTPGAKPSVREPRR